MVQIQILPNRTIASPVTFKTIGLKGKVCAKAVFWGIFESEQTKRVKLHCWENWHSILLHAIWFKKFRAGTLRLTVQTYPTKRANSMKSSKLLIQVFRYHCIKNRQKICTLSTRQTFLILHRFWANYQKSHLNCMLSRYCRKLHLATDKLTTSIMATPTTGQTKEICFYFKIAATTKTI